MRVVTTLLLTVSLTALVVGSAQAQPPGGRGRGQPGRGGMFGGPTGLLRMEAVQKELKLTDEQVAAVQKLNAGMRERFQGMREKFQEAQGDREKIAALVREMNDQVMKDVGKILKPEQMTRLKQLMLQQQGVLVAARDKDLAGKLKLTDDQVSKLQKVQQELMADMRELRGQGGPPDAETQKKMATVRKDATAKAMGVLTADQRKSWEEMTGKPFEFPAMGRRGGRRPPRGGNPPPL